MKLRDSTYHKGIQKIVVDDLGNTYVTDRENSITLYKANKTSFSFNEKRLGAVQSIDPSNPLKIVVHYADANQVLFLDNTLSLIGRVDLNNLGVFGMNVLVANSKLNGFWLFNPVELNLSRFDNEGSQQSGFQLNQYIKAGEKPLMLLEKNGRLYMSLSTGKLLVFDINATYLFQIPALGINDFRVEGDRLFYYNGNSIVIRELESVEQKELTLPGNLRTGKKAVVGIQCGYLKCTIALKNKLLFYENRR